MAGSMIRLNDNEVAAVKGEMKAAEFTPTTPEMEKVLTGRHADTNLLSVDEFWFVQKFIKKLEDYK